MFETLSSFSPYCINWTLRNWNTNEQYLLVSIEAVLIGPCGIETSDYITVGYITTGVLIGPCGIETVITPCKYRL